MPLNSGWREEIEEDLASEFDDLAIAEVEEKILEVNRELQKYQSTAWMEMLDELRAEQRQAFAVMMSTDDEKLLLAAREKARILEQIVGRPARAERRFTDLSHQRQVLAGEAEEEE